MAFVVGVFHLVSGVLVVRAPVRSSLLPLKPNSKKMLSRIKLARAALYGACRPFSARFDGFVDDRLHFYSLTAMTLQCWIDCG